MPLYRNGHFEDDSYIRHDGETSAIDMDGPLIVSLETFITFRVDLLKRDAPLGVFIAAGENIEDLVDDLAGLDIVALDFPVFSDGRNYSSARILRERFVFKGEIRAVGDVLIDQIPLMKRCGIDAFEITHEPTIKSLETGHWPEISRYLQPVGLGEVPAGTRPWARTQPV
ncbi:MAG: hypothetical protein COB90_02390 [Hyphomicrobiales bacterium]|nr:MAG: hypothetical protein COB90_02390 [Hyphomicrobiales bacterium]